MEWILYNLYNCNYIYFYYYKSTIMFLYYIFNIIFLVTYITISYLYKKIKKIKKYIINKVLLKRLNYYKNSIVILNILIYKILLKNS